MVICHIFTRGSQDRRLVSVILWIRINDVYQKYPEMMINFGRSKGTSSDHSTSYIQGYEWGTANRWVGSMEIHQKQWFWKLSPTPISSENYVMTWVSLRFPIRLTQPCCEPDSTRRGSRHSLPSPCHYVHGRRDRWCGHPTEPRCPCRRNPSCPHGPGKMMKDEDVGMKVMKASKETEHVDFHMIMKSGLPT